MGISEIEEEDGITEIEEVGESSKNSKAAIRKELLKMDEQLDFLWSNEKLITSRSHPNPKQQQRANGEECSKSREIHSNNSDDDFGWEINLNDITFRELIDKDSDSSVEVYKGSYDGQDVTVTVFELREQNQNPSTSENANNLPMGRSTFRKKVSFWYKIDHPNIVKLIGAKIDEPEFNLRLEKGEARVIRNMSYLVLEHFCGISLRSFLTKNKEKMVPFITVIQMALHLARGLACLHSKKLIHGNVMPENMVLDKDLQLKITDFQTGQLQISNYEDLTSDCHTITYMAPEVMDSKPYDEKSDVYGFGICLWEMYCREKPYPQDKGFSQLTTSICYQNLRPKIPKECPKDLASLIQRCWDTDPVGRPEMKEVVSLLEDVEMSGGKKNKCLGFNSCFCFSS